MVISQSLSLGVKEQSPPLMCKPRLAESGRAMSRLTNLLTNLLFCGGATGSKSVRSNFLAWAVGQPVKASRVDGNSWNWPDGPDGPRPHVLFRGILYMSIMSHHARGQQSAAGRPPCASGPWQVLVFHLQDQMDMDPGKNLVAPGARLSSLTAWPFFAVPACHHTRRTGCWLRHGRAPEMLPMDRLTPIPGPGKLGNLLVEIAPWTWS